MTEFLTYQNYYLVGLKGVAQTSLAQCLRDAQKHIAGADVAEVFVTQPILDTLHITCDIGFSHELPKDTDCVVFSAAHGADENPLVVQAKTKNIPLFSQAEALAALFNQKKGIAVCGVGGKSTISAMISWIFEKTNQKPSFSVGVGEIIGLGKTGAWNEASEYFIAEADDYVINPTGVQRGEKMIPRFSFLKPFITVATTISYDHPDVYTSFDHTKQVFADFFNTLPSDGLLISNENNNQTIDSMRQQHQLSMQPLWYGFDEENNAHISYVKVVDGVAYVTASIDGQIVVWSSNIPGRFNLVNGLAALLVAKRCGIDLDHAAWALTKFASTKRRFELVGVKQGITYYDDYAHHPSEVAAVIAAMDEWFPGKRVVFAFQSHTYSRTRELFDEFVSAFGKAKEVVMIDIFASAREKDDSSMSSDVLCAAIEKAYPEVSAQNFHTIENLAQYLKNSLKSGDICITVGAGDIYEVHEQL